VQKPPPLVLLSYRLLGWRVGPAYREWVHDDITRRGWVVRQGLPVLAAVLAVGGLVTAAVGGSGNRLLALVVVLAGGGLALRTSLQERALRQQGLDAGGRPTASWYDDDTARARRNALGAVSTVVLVGAALTILALRSR
jgi:hypothetical protein